MSIHNATKRSLFIKDLEVAKSLNQKALGLMFRKQLPKQKALLMPFSKEGFHGIWMFCMRFPIDIIFLNAKKQVVDIKKNAKPLRFDPRTWKIYSPQKPAKYVIETASGVSSKIDIGDVLKF